MPRPRKGSRIYTRERGGVTRHYADFREFADVLLPGEGAGRMPLIADGDDAATTDLEIAERLFMRKRDELRDRKRNKVATGRWKSTTLATFSRYHLEKKAQSGKAVERWLQTAQNHLQEAVNYFGAGRDPASITTEDVQRYVEHLTEQPSGRGTRCTDCSRTGAPVEGDPLGRVCDQCDAAWAAESLSSATVRKYINSLSNLYQRLASENYVAPGFNPVAALMDKPTAGDREAEWLEVADAALLLEAASRHSPKRDDVAFPPEQLYAILATFLLTGGRKSEVLGLTIEDVSFDLGKVFFRPNRWRRLKTRKSRRWVPMWPQLRDVLVQYVASMGDRPADSLLFPSTRRKGEEGMITDLRKALDAVATRAGWKAGEIRTKMFRHTYASARIQTVEHEQPVSVFTVSRELGHSSVDLVERTYGHLADRGRSHRAEVVEYRVEQHREHLAPRLGLLVGVA